MKKIRCDRQGITYKEFEEPEFVDPLIERQFNKISLEQYFTLSIVSHKFKEIAEYNKKNVTEITDGCNGWNGKNIKFIALKNLIKTSQNIIILNLSNCGLEASHIFELRKLNFLRELNVAKNALYIDGTIALTISLTINNNKKPNKLVSLNIAENYIGPIGTKSISKSFPNLHTLNIANNSIESVGADFISEKLTNLHTLNIANNSIGYIGARLIAEKMVNLKVFDIRNNDIEKIGEDVIKAMPNYNNNKYTIFMSDTD